MKAIQLSLQRTDIQNPVLHCAIYLYRHMKDSTLKNAYKKEFRT